jgi:hypothetical protein
LIAIKKKSKSVVVHAYFQKKNMLILCHGVCVSNIEKTMDNKNLILNATPQNIAIKVGTRRLKKKHL